MDHWLILKGGEVLFIIQKKKIMEKEKQEDFEKFKENRSSCRLEQPSIEGKLKEADRSNALILFDASVSGSVKERLNNITSSNF